MGKCKRCGAFTNFKNKLCKKCYYKMKKKNKKQKFQSKRSVNLYVKYRKFIAPIGIALLLILYFIPQTSLGKKTIFESGATDNPLIKDFKESFTFSNNLEIIFIIVLAITLWFGYKSWLLRIRILRRNRKIIRNITLVAILIILLNKIKAVSVLGVLADWLLFLLALYFVLAATLILLKWINSLDLRSDLNCWGLRIVGGLLILLGIFLLFTSSLSLLLVGNTLILENIFWIASLCITFIGLFCEFRSTRRYPMIGIWQ